MHEFYRTTIEVEILSEEPYEYVDLKYVYHDITYGDCSGVVKVVRQEIMSSKEAANALKKQGNDPGFFMLDDDGNEQFE